VPERAAYEDERYPEMLRKSYAFRLPHSPAPPVAGAILDPARSRTVSASRLQTEERHMLTIYDQIQELRAELASCILTYRERAQAEAELQRLIAEQAKLDRAFDAALAEKAPPG
jgi:hypothetical protein